MSDFDIALIFIVVAFALMYGLALWQEHREQRDRQKRHSVKQATKASTQ